MANKHNAGVPGFVAKPGGGGRPVPARHVASLTSEANNVIGGLQKGHRSLLWAPAAFLSTVIEAFRKVPFFILRKKKWQLLSVLPTFEKNVILLAPFNLALLENMAIANLAKSFCTDLGSLIRNARTQCGIFRDFV